jgi:hypothetical protein
VAPSTTLRKWFGHDPGRFPEFRRRYLEELGNERPGLSELRRRAREGALTLVYAARDSQHNEAVVLAEVIRRGLPRAGSRMTAPAAGAPERHGVATSRRPKTRDTERERT